MLIPAPLLDRIFSHPLLRERPPVLVDIGAAVSEHSIWAAFRRRAIVLSFDPDRREADHLLQDDNSLRSIVRPTAASNEPRTSIPVHLTRAPFCSSTLRPKTEALQPWIFSDLFEVVESVDLPADHLPAVLAQEGIDYVDWFKSDTQGTDLRLFLSLPEPVRRRVLAVEFEPGFIEAYEGEDNVKDVLAAMGQEPFWLAHFEALGTLRLSRETLARHLPAHADLAYHRFREQAPAWANMTYLNEMPADLGLRSLLLGWVFSTILDRHGFALEVASRALALSPGNALAGELLAYSKARIEEDIASTLPRPKKKGWLARLFGSGKRSA